MTISNRSGIMHIKESSMNKNEIMRIYNQEGREAALPAFREAIEESKGQEEKLNELAFLAADFADSEALKLLFQAGVSPQLTDKYAFNLLHYLARQNESNYHPKPKGAVAETAALLLDNKVSAIRKDENEKMCSYHYAARNGLVEMVKFMAERGVKLNMTDKDGNTGIYIAADYAANALIDIKYKKRNLEIAKTEYDKKINQLKANNQTDEQIAEYVSKWITRTPEKAQADLDAALQLMEDYFQTVKAFVAGGVDMDEKNSYGKSALDIAVEKSIDKIAAYLSGTLTDESDESAIAAGGMTLHQAAEKGDAKAIKAIAAAGADLNSLKDDKEYKFGGCTALAIAVAFHHVDAVETLLACGANPSFKDGNGRAAASFLVFGSSAAIIMDTFTEKRIPAIIKNLLSAGMDINMPVNDDSDTLLLLACKSGSNAGYSRYTVKGEIIAEVMKHNPDINHVNQLGETALMHASARNFEIMEGIQVELLELGANVNLADNNGDTALHYAARNDDKNGAKILCDMLLEFGANAQAVNNEGKTALDIATEQDNEPLVKLLLSK